MAKKSAKSKLIVEAIRHEDASRKNIPTAEYESVMEETAKYNVRVAYERRKSAATEQTASPVRSSTPTTMNRASSPVMPIS